ncbi:hypothetical protein ADILRU_2105 [Leifsonia rubra CMS 76R]|nr:hypothetical protein ADILRU_2105 [Leifsonia rubra CMS 76R]
MSKNSKIGISDWSSLARFAHAADNLLTTERLDDSIALDHVE